MNCEKVINKLLIGDLIIRQGGKKRYSVREVLECFIDALLLPSLILPDQ